MNKLIFSEYLLKLMSLKLKSLAISILFFSFNVYMSAQVTADFEMDKTTGCGAQVITFTNNSTPSTGLTYQWIFGTGNTSTLENPTELFETPQTYEVKLIVTDGVDTDTVQKSLNIYENPEAGFSANVLKGCVPLDVTFTSSSTQGDAPIEKYIWDLGQGYKDTVTGNKYYHTFQSAGSYSVNLKVIDGNGCSDENYIENYIDVGITPTASFYATPSASCAVPVDVSFTNVSSGTGNLNYLWTFGDGGSSNEENPTHTYTSFDNYTVSLTVTSTDYNCSNTRELLYYVNDVTAAGELTQDGVTINNEDTICEGTIDFNNTSTGTPFCSWILDGTSQKFDQSGSFSILGEGDHTLLLIASPGNSCADTVSWTFYVETVEASFEMDREYSCRHEETVQFTDSSKNAVSWEWTFEDGSNSSDQNTSYTFTLPPDDDEYAVNTDYYFSTLLTVTSRNGCTDSYSKSFHVKKPTAKYSIDKVKGCIPLQVTFTDKSLSDKNIVSREWLFDDGSTSNGNDSIVQHDFSSTGNFSPLLVITNSDGCTDTSYSIGIKAGEVPQPNFEVVPIDACSNLYQFNDLTPADNDIDEWHYTADDSSFFACSGEANPVDQFNKSTGSQSITLTVGTNGCYADTTIENAVVIDNPISNFEWSMHCDNPLTYHFKGDPQSHTSFKWILEPGVTNTTDLNPVHTFSSEGDYTVEFIAEKGACTDTFRRVISARVPNARFSSDTIGCANKDIIFDGSPSFTISNKKGERYLWDFGEDQQGQYTPSDSVTHVFEERGTYDVKLIAIYDNGCVDSITKPIHVYQPYAEFQMDTTMGCSPFKVEFTDESTPDTHPIDQFIWQFGDDTDTSYSIRSAPFDHWYSQPREYLTLLTVMDTLGCTATKEANIYTANPDATFSSIGNTYICAGSDITLTYGYSGADSVLWDFGDGSTSGSQDRPITRSYNDGGTFPVSLIIYKYGCIDTSTIEDLVKVQDADAYFEVSDSVVNCYPAEITFHHDSSGIDIIDGSWAYGYTDQVVPGYASDRVFTYPSPGTFPVTLEITTSFGCTNSHTRDIVVSGPSGAMDVSPATACINTPITFRLKDTANLYDYEWILGDGSSVTASPYVHKYDKVGKIYYSLVLYGDSGRCVAPPLEDSIMIHELKAIFENEDTLVCEQEQLTFTNQSIGATSLQWNFGNGNTSSATNGEQIFTAGNYQVDLVVWNDIGCQDTFSQDIVVRPAPPITTRGDTLICYGGSALLYAAGGDEVEWTPAAGLNNPLSYSPFASPKSTTIYTATVKDKATGCTSSANVNIEVQPPPPYSIIPVDTTIIIGEMVEIHVETDENVTISWIPGNDISCIDCTTPLVRTLESRTYTVTIKDKHGCFTIVEDVNINIKEAYSVDVPTMFTPNADGNNDVVYVRGWGIKELIEFRIYNRWGNEVFSTSDITQGWDGKVNGNDQPMDTYVYVVSIETYSGEIMSKKGNITLLR